LESGFTWRSSPTEVSESFFSLFFSSFFSDFLACYLTLIVIIGYVARVAAIFPTELIKKMAAKVIFFSLL